MLAKYARLTALETGGFCRSLGQARQWWWLCEVSPPLPGDSCLAQPLPYLNRNFSALPISAVSLGLLLRSKVGAGVERHLIWAPGTLIVHSTKLFSQILSHNICDPVCEICIHVGFWEGGSLDSYHLLSQFVSVLVLAIPRAVLVPNPSLWASACVNGQLPFFLIMIFKEWA